MTRKVLSILLVFVLMGLFVVGCKDKDTEPTEERVGTMEEYYKQAEKEITEENAEKELERLQKEIDTEIGAE